MKVVVTLSDGSRHALAPIPDVWGKMGKGERAKYCTEVLVSRGVLLPNVTSITSIDVVEE